MALLGGSLTGSALTAIIVCLSQSPGNAQQSRHALEFGEEFSKLCMDRLQPNPPESIDKLWKQAQALIKENAPALKKSSENKFVIRRQAMARDAMARLHVLELMK